MIHAKQAKKILPKSEFEQFEAVIENQISRMSEARLKQKATISRKLRQKYKGLAREQSVAAKRKLTNETDVSLNENRARIFDELIDRIEQELDRTDRRPPRPRRKAPRRSTTSTDAQSKKAILEAKRRPAP